ncbi:MAG: prepilin-type N-terminal cleavage/methylation domain-containing protein [Thermodesulfobacteriota bacterium]
MRNLAKFLINKASIPRNILRNPKGLSLLETLIAIIILALALASISYFFSTARGNIEASGHMRSDLVLAQDKMEQLKDLGYSHPDLSEGTHSDEVDTVPERPGPEVYREWNVELKRDPADGIADDDDYKLVDLKVYDQRLNPGNETPNDPNKLVAEVKTYISP